jgi:hypothetical protein
MCVTSASDRDSEEWENVKDCCKRKWIKKRINILNGYMKKLMQ